MEKKTVGLLFDNQHAKYVYDFTKKRVREIRTIANSSMSSALSKFSIGYIVSHNGDYYKGLLIEQDAYSYEEAKQILLELLETKQFKNVTIIK